MGIICHMFSSIRKSAFNKPGLTLLVLLLIAGQSFATPTGCDSEHFKSDIHSSDGMDHDNTHAGHDMTQMNMSTGLTEMSDCCVDDCQCAQACSTTLTMISNKTGFKLFNDASSLVQEPNSFYNSQASSALFRPPIIC